LFRLSNPAKLWLQAEQDALAEVKDLYLKFIKRRDEKAWRKLGKLAQARPSAAASLALTKVWLPRRAVLCRVVCMG
jgi:hypothetical protein